MTRKKKNGRGIHLRLDEKVILDAQIRCLQEGLVLSYQVEELLREWLKTPRRAAKDSKRKDDR